MRKQTVQIPKTRDNLRIIQEELLPVFHEIFLRMEVRKAQEREDRAFKKGEMKNGT